MANDKKDNVQNLIDDEIEDINRVFEYSVSLAKKSTEKIYTPQEIAKPQETSNKYCNKYQGFKEMLLDEKYTDQQLQNLLEKFPQVAKGFFKMEDNDSTLKQDIIDSKRVDLAQFFLDNHDKFYFVNQKYNKAAFKNVLTETKNAKDLAMQQAKQEIEDRARSITPGYMRSTKTMPSIITAKPLNKQENPQIEQQNRKRKKNQTPKN
jgi:hypothetical protein